MSYPYSSHRSNFLGGVSKNKKFKRYTKINIGNWRKSLLWESYEYFLEQYISFVWWTILLIFSHFFLFLYCCSITAVLTTKMTGNLFPCFSLVLQFTLISYVNLRFSVYDYLIFDLFPIGLDIDTCHIIEMACLITDEKLNIVAEVGINK